MDIKVLIYWFVVGVPLSWGLYKSVEKSLPLFAAKPVPAAVAPAAAPGPAAVVAPSSNAPASPAAATSSPPAPAASATP